LVRGGYPSCLPLLRAACDCIGAQRGLAEGDGDEFADWLAAMSQSREHAALELGLGRYRAGSRLATGDRLGAAYRVLTELSMPHFGSTLVQAAPESDLRQIRIGFADATFHLGWAQLILGWLLELVIAQFETVAGAGDTFGVSPDARERWTALSSDVQKTLAKPDRCRVKELGDGRYLFQNFRRQPGGAPRRLFL
jgi:hypothetical protein